MLQIKREFVRYVSHEIRSPLNVVHAGLELLRADLEAAGVIQSVSDLLQDIYFASNTAIEILNEMLQYEHIDSGTFKLECAALRLVQCFEGRLDSYKYMASKKDIALHIEDFARVSEFSLCSFNSDTSRQSTSTVTEAMFESMVLYIDKFRVEQIIRNLMTNAIKFTPEGGRVTIRFLLVEDSEFKLSERVLSERDLIPRDIADSLKASQLCLRIEVADSGAGCSNFKSINIITCLLN